MALPVRRTPASATIAMSAIVEVAEAVGFASLAAYVADRRSAGATWSSMTAETGLPEATLRRRALRDLHTVVLP